MDFREPNTQQLITKPYSSTLECGFFFDNNLNGKAEKLKLEIIKSKSGIDTCKVNGILLHSMYDPFKEAERFASFTPIFNPKYIAVTEPALSYSSIFLRKKFPHARLICIRYTDMFTEYDSTWDKTFVLSENTGENLFNYMGEDGIAQCIFLSWKSSESAFKNEYEKCWNQIKECVLKSQSVLATQSFFSIRWLKNSCRFFMTKKKLAGISKGNSPILVCASGTSLESSIKKIREHRNKFFLIAVSSALSPLVNSNILPDLCLSTDGGFWAKPHIGRIIKNKNITLALSPESSIYSQILTQTPVIPLNYGDGCSNDLFNEFKVNGISARRNGTVSGTALELAKSITTGPVFLTGLDLSSAMGFQHTQPNENEKINSLADNRLKTKETRIAPQTFPSHSLEIYCQWFKNYDNAENVYRLSSNHSFNNTLGKIKDINWNDFESMAENFKTDFPEIELQKNSEIFDFKKRLQLLENSLSKNMDSISWKKELFPGEMINLERCLETETSKAEDAKNSIKMKQKKITESILDPYRKAGTK